MATFFKTIRKTVKYWYVPAIIGALFVVLGFYLFTVPLETYATLTVLFSLSFLVTGLLETWFSIQNREELEGWGWHLISGLFSLAIGILLVTKPEISALTLPMFIGFSLLFRAFQGLGFSFELKNYGVSKWGNLAIASVLGILFSFVLIFNPTFTGMSLVVMTALTFIFVGVSGIAMAFMLKKLKSFPQKITKELKEKIEDLREEYYEHLEDRKRD